MNNNLTCRRLSRMLGRRYTQLVYNTRVSVCVRAFFFHHLRRRRCRRRRRGRGRVHGDKDFDEYHDKTRSKGTDNRLADHRRRRRHSSSTPPPPPPPPPSPPRYNIIHTLALAYTHHAELLLLYRCNAVYEIYIRTSHGVFFIFQFFFYSLIFVRSVSARPVSVGNYSVISVTLPLLYDDVIIQHIRKYACIL